MATITLGDPEGSYVTVQFPYDPGIVELLKSIPATDRSYDPATKVWRIKRHWLAEFASTAVRAGHILDMQDAAPSPRQARTNADNWADVMFAAIPQRLHAAVHKALQFPLHPDTGGDLTACQELNSARDRLKTGAAR